MSTPVGGYVIKDGHIKLNEGRERVTITVRNTGDRPIQIGSHFHFFEVNRALEFDRTAAFGMRLTAHLGGNVAEWVQDWWDPTYYGTSPTHNPRGPNTGDFRVVRGGSWNQPAYGLRSSARSYHNPLKGAGHIGFRCAQAAADTD